jgi:hypothetical protein
VAFAAVTVKVDELPATIEVGLAVMPTVGAAEVPVEIPPHPVNSRGSKKPAIIKERIRGRDLRTRAFVTVFSFLSP